MRQKTELYSSMASSITLLQSLPPSVISHSIDLIELQSSFWYSAWYLFFWFEIASFICRGKCAPASSLIDELSISKLSNY